MDTHDIAKAAIRKLRKDVSRLPPFEVCTADLHQLRIKVNHLDLSRANPSLICSPWAEAAFEQAYDKAPDYAKPEPPDWSNEDPDSFWATPDTWKTYRIVDYLEKCLDISSEHLGRKGGWACGE